MGRLCYPTTAPAGSRYPAPAGPESCHGARRVWRTFCKSWYKFSEDYACRGTSLIGAGKLSRYRILIGGTGAVSRYKLSRSQITVTMQDLYCVQVSVSGCKMLNEFIWPAEQGMMIKDQKKKERSGPYSTNAFCSAGVYVTRQKV
jgi:hypothetical protein